MRISVSLPSHVTEGDKLYFDVTEPGEEKTKTLAAEIVNIVWGDDEHDSTVGLKWLDATPLGIRTLRNKLKQYSEDGVAVPQPNTFERAPL